MFEWFETEWLCICWLIWIKNWHHLHRVSPSRYLLNSPILLMMKYLIVERRGSAYQSIITDADTFKSTFHAKEKFPLVSLKEMLNELRYYSEMLSFLAVIAVEVSAYQNKVIYPRTRWSQLPGKNTCTHGKI